MGTGENASYLKGVESCQCVVRKILLEKKKMHGKIKRLTCSWTNHVHHYHTTTSSFGIYIDGPIKMNDRKTEPFPIQRVKFNPLQDDKILDWPKLKQIANYTLKCIQNGK